MNRQTLKQRRLLARAERTASEYERRVQWHKDRGKPVPHKLQAMLFAARTQALSVARMERVQ